MERGGGMGLAAVRDLREARAPGSPEELAAFETDVMAGFVLARAAAGLPDRTISLDVWHLEQARAWSGRPLREMAPADADGYSGKVLRGAAKGHPAVAGAVAEDLLHVLGAAAQGRDLPADRARGRVPGR